MELFKILAGGAVAMGGFFLFGWGASEFAPMKHWWACIGGAVLIWLAGMLQV